ncbi:hypothetical protein SMB34_15560 [Thalassospira permensis NBRC 106175]|uniref:Uncharacterized protein n=1 Tax=Thalassospira permensis NBRC 106175 TaxID=1353532 RepID=A0ABR4TQY0_9PROT|nr:hypothetical protein SMB34_15560 [Thalassospira permensis NBRC 106175]
MSQTFPVWDLASGLPDVFGFYRSIKAGSCFEIGTNK